MYSIFYFKRLPLIFLLIINPVPILSCLLWPPYKHLLSLSNLPSFNANILIQYPSFSLSFHQFPNYQHHMCIPWSNAYTVSSHIIFLFYCYQCSSHTDCLYTFLILIFFFVFETVLFIVYTGKFQKLVLFFLFIWIPVDFFLTTHFYFCKLILMLFPILSFSLIKFSN